MSSHRRWSDFFHLNRGERHGLIVLLTILTGALIWHALIPQFVSPETANMPDYSSLILKFEERRERIIDSLKKQKIQVNLKSPDKASLNPFPFDPNNLPAKQWMAMGLSENKVRVIKNYERQGGSFETPEDLRKIYSLTDAEFEILRPFIRIKSGKAEEDPPPPAGISDPSANDTSSGTAQPYPEPKSFQAEIKTSSKKPIFLSINEADTLDLQQLPGIGPVYARRIFRYRMLLGGFANREQLKEIYGMDSLRYAGIMEQILIDSAFIRTINLNRVELKKLIKHPYFDYALAKMILTERQTNGAFRSGEDFKNRMQLPDSVFLKISPYIGFSEPASTGRTGTREQ